MKEGDRVGVITDAARPEYGVYLGHQTGGPLGNYPNPKIKLDNGSIVWGCQCWWGPEEEIKAKYQQNN